MIPFLTIENGKLTIRRGERGKQVLDGKTVDDYAKAVEKAAEEANGHIMSSSTIDFPEEETKDPVIIAYCRHLRGANP